MKKLFLMVLLAVGLTTNAETFTSNEEESKSKTDLTLKDGETTDWTMHFGVGVNIATGAPDGYEFAPFKSWDLQWTVAQIDYTPKGASQTYSAGLGLNWRNYGLKDNNTMLAKTGDVVGLVPFTGNDGSRSSRIHTMGINVPLFFTQKFSKDFSFSVGPVVNFNLGGWINNSWEVGDIEHKSSAKKIGLRPVTVDIMGVFDISGLGIFCKYSPMSVFKKDRGPEFRSITVGLYL